MAKIEVVDISRVAYALKRAKAKNQNNSYDKSALVLIGAGASRSGGILLASELCEKLLENLEYKKRCEGIDPKNYAELMKKLVPDERREFLEQYIHAGKINTTHLYLASLVKAGYIGGVITTNFDLLMLQSLGIMNIFPAVYDITTLKSNLVSYFYYPCIVHLHGQMNGHYLLNIDDEMNANSIQVEKALTKLIDNRPLIIVGYSGADPVFKTLMNISSFEGGMFWVNYKNQYPTKKVFDELEGRVNHDVSFISEESLDSDTFFFKLHKELDLGEKPDLFSNPFTGLKDALDFVADNLKKEDGDFGLKKEVLASIAEAEIKYNKREIDIVEKARDAFLNEKYNLLDGLKIVAEGNDEALRYIANAYYDSGIKKAQYDKLEDALIEYNKAIEIDPKHYRAINNRGLIKEQLGKINDAIKDYKSAIKIAPTQPASYYNMGNVLDEKNKLKEALKYFDKAIELNTQYSKAYNNRGISNFKLEKYDTAIYDFTMAIEYNPNSAESYANRAIVYRKIEKNKKALQDINNAIRIDPNSSGFYSIRAEINSRLKHDNKAILDYNKAIELGRSDYKVYYNRSLSLFSLEKIDEAYADMKKALELNPKATPPDWYKP